MHECERINNMKHHAFEGAGVFCNDGVMIVRIGIGDAAAAGRDIVDPTLVERFEKRKKSAWTRHVLHIDQLFAATKLAGSNVILYVRDHHRDDGKGLRYARDLGHHSGFHDLCFNLPETSLQASPTGTFRDQDSGWTHEWIDNIAHAQRELLYLPAHAGPDHSFLQLYFGLL